MNDAVRMIADQVRTRVRHDGVDLASSGLLAEKYVHEELQRYSERALGGSLPLIPDEGAAAREVVASLTGFGALQAYLDDPEIEEVWINAPSRIFVARDGVPELTPTVLAESEVRDLVERMLQSSGRRVDLSSPFVDASLPDGSRLHVVIPDVTQRYWSVNIRKFTRRIRDVSQLVALGSLSQQAAEFLRMCVLANQNILVSGATQSGKTTMLNALLSVARPSERVVTAEETFELDLSARDVVSMQCRQPSLEGTGEITLRRLIKEALRMRPDRLIVGEVREAESLDLLIALNSGLPGMSSIHANSARDALSKLATLPLLAGRNIDSSFIVPTVAGCIDIVVHCEIDRHGRRRVGEIIAPSGNVTGGVIEASPIFRSERGALTATGGYPTKLAKFHSAGLDPALVLGRIGESSIVLGCLLGVGILLIASPLLWPRSASKQSRPPAKRLRGYLAAAGLSAFPPAAFTVLSVVLAIAAAATVEAVCGVAALSAAAGGVGLVIPIWLVSARVKARRRANRAVWPDTVDHLISAVRSGLALPGSVAALAQTGPAATREAFAQFERDYRVSGNFSQCVDALKERLADPIADRILETLRMAREVGGSDLTTVLRSLASYLREESAIRSEVEARQSWITNAARLGVAAPWVVLLLLASRPEAAVAYNSPAGTVVIAAGLAVSVVAYQVMLALGRLPAEQRWFR